MADAEFIADLALAVRDGIVSTTPGKLRALYKGYDDELDFELLAEIVTEQVWDALDFAVDSLSEIQGTFATKPHVFHSLISALIHNRFGLPNGVEATDMEPTGSYYADARRAIDSIKRLAAAHEEKEMGEFAEYVRASSEGGNRAAQRAVRVKWLCRALRGEFA